jgi:hypothetical protein
MSERYLENEDNLNSLIVNLRNLIKSFSTLSRDKIENVILTANTMIKEGENNLKIMEEEVNNLGIQQQFGSKLKNYKMEFQNLLSKFQSSQDKYINQKANKAIILGIDEVNSNVKDKQKIELITNDENNNNKSPNNSNNDSDIIGKVEIQQNFESNRNKEYNLGFGLNNNNLHDDLDLNIRNERNSRFTIIITSLVLIFILIVLTGIITYFLGNKKK